MLFTTSGPSPTSKDAIPPATANSPSAASGLVPRMASRMFDAAKSAIMTVEPMVMLPAQLSLKDQSVPRPAIGFDHPGHFGSATFFAPRRHNSTAAKSSNVRPRADAKAHNRMLQSGAVEAWTWTLTMELLGLTCGPKDKVTSAPFATSQLALNVSVTSVRRPGSRARGSGLTSQP